MRITPNNIQQLADNEIFVFGSNAEGRHIGGAARYAHLNFGAKMGIGRGFTGQCYAIDSMSGLEVLKEQIQPFIEVAKVNPDKIFLVTEIGCGIAGYSVEEIAPFFYPAMPEGNIYLPKRFWEVLNTNK